MRLRFWLAFLVLLFSPILARADLIYPLQETPSITSTFGQYRTGHPHGGLDLWTFLKIGTPVLAADGGYIFRIKCSPGGYGRVLYQRLQDGRIAVYAHLSGFSPAIEAIVRADQKKQKRYTLDKILSGNEIIRVKQGEVIAFAGDTGTDVPHLHFEIRDRDGFPINPLVAGFPAVDSLAPVVAELHLEPLSWDAHINGGKSEQFLPCKRQSGNTFACGSATADGRIGLSVNAYDLLDGSPRQLAPYDIQLFVDGAKRFHHRFSTFNYAKTYVSTLSYYYRLKVQQRGRFVRLFRLYERTVFHPETDDGGLSNLPDGPHELRIQVTDEKGLRVNGLVTLNIRPEGRVEPAGERQTENKQPGQMLAAERIEWRGDHAVIEARGGWLSSSSPQISAEAIYGSREIKLGKIWCKSSPQTTLIAVDIRPIDDGKLNVYLDWKDAQGVPRRQTMRFLFQTARNGHALSSDDGLANLDIPAGALFAPVPLQVSSVKVGHPRWLEPVGQAYRFDAPWEPLRKKLHLSLKPPAGTTKTKLGIYLYDQGTWWHMGAGTNAAVPAFGTYALARDIVPPAVTGMETGPGRTPTIKIFLSDVGSGIEEKTIDIRVDGTAQFFEYVPFKQHLLVRVDEPLAAGTHNVTATVRDRAGNSTSRKFVFTR